MKNINEAYHTKLKNWMLNHTITHKHLIFNDSCHSVIQAANISGENINIFVKNICMIDSQENLIIAIVKGQDRASTSRVSKALHIERPRLATSEEILNYTNYPCGGIPSFGYSGRFLIDPKVMELDVIITGGGSEYSLIRISTQNLLNANNGQVVRVRK